MSALISHLKIIFKGQGKLKVKMNKNNDFSPDRKVKLLTPNRVFLLSPQLYSTTF